METLRFVLVEGIALPIAAKTDHLAQMLQGDEMFAPEVIEGLQQEHLLDPAHVKGSNRLRRTIARALDIGDDFPRLAVLAIELIADLRRVHGLRRRTTVDPDQS